MDSYLQHTIKLAQYYQSLGERTFEQVTDDELFWRPDPSTNSIAIIVQHMAGNMRSRWTNLMTEDGEKPWRQREAEFSNTLATRVQVLETWREGWACFLGALNLLQPHDLSSIIYIRNEGHTIADAIQRQMAHYPYHVGQIVLLGKMQQKKNWISLSIPKGLSQAYNKDKFDQGPSQKHFTDAV